jgi:SAM-dependent methyltransferase
MYLKNHGIQVAKDILIRFPKRVIRFFEFIGEMISFRKNNDGRFSVKWSDMYPCLKDKLETTPFDQHYIYHPAWAARVLAKTLPEYHIDFSSKLEFCTIVSAFVPVKFYDYRPANLNLSNLESSFGDLTNIALPDDSQPSVSCMHTIEHVGLGRYGDPLDPQGDLKAIAELKRIVKPGGDMLFVTPVGTPKIEFNGQRVYSYSQIIEHFAPFKLIDFSLIPDIGSLIENADPELIKQQNYACGCFWFKK